VEAFLREVVERPGPPLLYQMARYHLGWEDANGDPSDAGGKMVRSGLCLLACEASGGQWRYALPAAAAVEFVHSFSLVHDDIQDRDRERHHRPAVWTVWGEAQAINAGDALLALARVALARLSHDSELHARAAAILDEATLEMVEGQVLDLEFESRATVTVDEYLGMVDHKTGALFGAALALGALTAGADAERCQRFVRLGRLLGVAFQVKDDLLGTWGDEARTGKPAGADVARRKKSLPLVVGLNGEAAPAMHAAYGRAAGPDVGSIIAAMERAGVREECERMGGEARVEALRAIAAMELSDEAGQEFSEAVGFLLERDY
jgi:geranylgeranyl diphosphate synthase type I